MNKDLSMYFDQTSVIRVLGSTKFELIHIYDELYELIHIDFFILELQVRSELLHFMLNLR